MGTTPNLAIPYPEDSDLVTDGAAAMRAIAEATDTALADYSARIFPTADQTIAAAADVVIACAGETFDNGGLHSTTTNNHRLTIPAGGDGLYLVIACLSHNPTSGYVSTRIRINGANRGVAGATAGSGGITDLVRTELFALVAGDYVEMAAYQNAGGIVYGNANGDASYLAIKRLA